METLFTEADLEKIRDVTSRAEANHLGEIVPYMVGRVDDHDEARWRGATIGAMLASLLAGSLYGFEGFWGTLGMPWITLPTIVGAGLGFMLAAYPPLSRKLLTDADIDRRVQRRAQAAFLEEQVFLTEKRTGILIFLAVFEHRAIILADKGIHQVIPAETWSDLVNRLVAGIKAGQAAEALCETIERCGEILQKHDIPRANADIDELSNDLRVRDA